MTAIIWVLVFFNAQDAPVATVPNIATEKACIELGHRIRDNRDQVFVCFRYEGKV
jgi:hypothetical protein